MWRSAACPLKSLVRNFTGPLLLSLLPVLLQHLAFIKLKPADQADPLARQPSAPAAVVPLLLRNMPRSWRALFGRAERPSSLADNLSALKVCFKHSGPAVEAYIRQQPSYEWKPWFEEALCQTLREMKSYRHQLQDSETELASPLFCL